MLMTLTSFIKTKTRIIEKNILTYEKNIANLKNNLYEAELDYYYLSSPKIISKNIIEYSDEEYSPVDYSRIYFSLNQFLDEKKKLLNLLLMKKKLKKNKNFNKNQKSFYFEDYIETNLKQKDRSKSFISEDRIYILFFFLFLFNNYFFN